MIILIIFVNLPFLGLKCVNICKNLLIFSSKYIIFIVIGGNRDKSSLRNSFNIESKVQATANEIAADDSTWRNLQDYQRPLRNRSRHTRRIPCRNHLRTVIPIVRICPFKARTHSRTGKPIHVSIVPKEQKQAIPNNLRRFFILRYSNRCIPSRSPYREYRRSPLRYGDLRKSSLRQALQGTPYY